MLSIRFQNPTQGPLITVSFGDSDGVTLALVPAALSSAPAGVAATSGVSSGGAAAGFAMAGPLALAAICAGDSSPRHLMPEVTTQPLRGLSRFNSYASAVLPGAESDAQAVALSVDPTDTVATDAATSVDWAALFATNLDAFFTVAADQIDRIKHEVIRRLDRGDTPESVVTWLRSVAIPELERMEAPMFNSVSFDYKSLVHDTCHKIADLMSMLPHFLDQGRVEDAREYCRTDLQHMERLIAQLRLTFMGRAIIQKGDNLVTFEVHSPEDAKQLLRILENLVRNAADHSKDGEIPFVTISRDGDRLIVTDDASGMSTKVVQKLRDGVRIHDGEDVTEGRHGFGWQSIRETSDKLGIKWDLQSELGKGTTVTLTVPDGFFVSLR